MTKVCETCARSYLTRHAKQRVCSRICAKPLRAQAMTKRRASLHQDYLAKKFRKELQQLGPHFTQMDLLIILQGVYTHGYQAGHRRRWVNMYGSAPKVNAVAGLVTSARTLKRA